MSQSPRPTQSRRNASRRQLLHGLTSDILPDHTDNTDLRRQTARAALAMAAEEAIAPAVDRFLEKHLAAAPDFVEKAPALPPPLFDSDGKPVLLNFTL